MNKEVLFKYLDFLKKECSRHATNNFIDEDEVNQLNLEIKKFQTILNESEIPEKIKKEVFKIDFNLDEENHHKPKLNWLKIVGGRYGREYREQANRKNRFEKLSIDLENLIFHLKLIS